MASQKQHQKLIENEENRTPSQSEGKLFPTFNSILSQATNLVKVKIFSTQGINVFFFQLSMNSFSGNTGGCTSSKQKDKK